MRLCASSVFWYEFLCGPVSAEETRLVRALLTGGVIDFNAEQAGEASRLFNSAGRNRRLRIDAMIAACAVCSGAELATSNREDFLPFAPFGLLLA
jgi:predicted nucleic acid-binding protein